MGEGRRSAHRRFSSLGEVTIADLRALLAAHAETRSKLGLAVKALEEIEWATFDPTPGDIARSTLALIDTEDFSPAQDLPPASGDVTSPGSEANGAIK